MEHVPLRTLVGGVLLRGVLAPWVHPLYTGLTGIGIGLARESRRWRWAAPLGTFAGAVALHALWNLSAAIPLLFLLALPLWGLGVCGYLAGVILLVRRRGAILRPLGNVVVLMPPLAMTEAQLGELARITRESIDAAVAGL